MGEQTLDPESYIQDHKRKMAYLQSSYLESLQTGSCDFTNVLKMTGLAFVSLFKKHISAENTAYHAQVEAHASTEN